MDNNNSKIIGILQSIFFAIRLVWSTNRKYTIINLVCVILQSVLPVAQLLVSKQLINKFVEFIQIGLPYANSQLISISELIGIQAGLILANSGLTSLQGVFRSLLSEQLTNNINIKILNKANMFSIKYFENDKFYNRLKNATQESNYRPLQIKQPFFCKFESGISTVL